MAIHDASDRPAYRSGHVYILTNPAMPGLLKIGHTGRTPEIRAAELSAATGVPGRFAVAWSHPIRGDHETVEGITHGRLARYRVNEHREFFSCTVAQARRIIEQEARALLLPWWRVILHRLVHPVPAPRQPAWKTRPAWRRHNPGDLFGFYTTIGAVVLAGLVIHYRPVMPAWMPAGITSAAYALERLHP